MSFNDQKYVVQYSLVFLLMVLISKWILKQTGKTSSKLCFGTAKYHYELVITRFTKSIQQSCGKCCESWKMCHPRANDSLDSPRIETPVNLFHVFEGIHTAFDT